MQLTEYLRARKNILFGISDAALAAAALVVAFLLRFDGTLPAEYDARLPYYLLLYTGLNLLFLHYERMYSFTWSFVGLKELTRLWRALTYASAVFGLLVLLDTIGFFVGFPRSVILLSYLVSMLFIGSLRIAKRLWLELAHGAIPHGEPTLIVGAGRQGEHLIRHILGTPGLYRVIGIVDEKPTNQGLLIHGIPVLGSIRDLPRLVHDHNVKHVIIAFERDHAKAIRETVEAARNAGVSDIKIVPEYSELLGQKLSFRDLKEVSVEDLLGRDPAKIDTEEIKRFLHGRVVLVTGAAGSIGSELCRQISQFLPAKLAMLDFNESGIFDLEHELRRSFPNAEFVSIIASITDRPRIHALMKMHKPEVVFHAAAYKHVPLMEEHPEEAAKANILGTACVAKAAKEAGVQKFVLISTDKAVKPLSVMGKTKRAAEIVVKSLNVVRPPSTTLRIKGSPQADGGTQFVAVRFGNVLGSRGSVVPLFQEQIRHGGPVTVTHPDMTRYFMTIPEAALLVMEAGAIGKGGEVFVLDMGKPVKIIDLAHELIRLSGYEPDTQIPIVITGIRPGEKIFEELLTAEEGRTATKWEKIHIAKTDNRLNQHEVEERLRALEALFERNAPRAEEVIRHIDEFIN
ncbi:MAG: nucleoside-diphosphate sugar epimerase/dehydratase [bacterium]|nr:nucleoside-diphosphate sugar epimerase/dehydratase [bacterium]